MQSVAQNLIFGLFVGGIYGIAAVGLALVFGVLKVLNIAHGELLMIGGYISFWLFTLLGVDPFVSLLIAIPLLFVLGLILDLAVFRYIERLTGETRIKNSLLVSFGLTLVLQNLAIQLFTADERLIHVSYAGTGVAVLGVALPYTRLIGLLIALVVVLAVDVPRLTHTEGLGLRYDNVSGSAGPGFASELAGALLLVGCGLALLRLAPRGPRRARQRPTVAGGATPTAPAA
jgi:branched-chain amino acid transport system permease protein